MAEVVQRRILRRTGAVALILARQRIQSETLRRAIVFQERTALQGRLYIPHYWAIYQHDGRDAVFPDKKTYLVWYADPADDPRLRGGYPVRLSDVKSLTADDFYAGLEENRRREEANPSGGPMQFMIIRGPGTDPEFSPPGDGGKVRPFFDEMGPLLPETTKIASEEMSKEFIKLAREENDSVTLRL